MKAVSFSIILAFTILGICADEPLKSIEWGLHSQHAVVPAIGNKFVEYRIARPSKVSEENLLFIPTS